MRELLDALNGWMILSLIVIVLLLLGEVGFRMGARRRDAASEELITHVGFLLGALLALLGLMLAFSFGIAEERFRDRKSVVVKEANAIGTTYLRAGMLPEGHGDDIRRILREYVHLRVNVTAPEHLKTALYQSESLHHALWMRAEAVARLDPESEIISLFVASLNETIDLHEERVTVALHYRLPLTILAALFVVSMLAMSVLGYNAGLVRSRALAPTLAMILAIAVVEVLIIDLDRPWGGLITVNQHAMSDVQEMMSKVR